jgi:hypothetical protein
VRLALVLFLAFTLMLSHGSMGEAAPHFDGAPGHGLVTIDDHDGHHALPDQDDGDRDVGHATHVHLAGDLGNPHPGAAARRLHADAGPRPRVRVDALASLRIAPLLEPPAA